MTNTMKKRIVAVLACIAIGVIAPSAVWKSFAENAESAPQYVYRYTDTEGAGEATGVKITLPAKERTAEYTLMNDVDAEDLAENGLKIRMVPQDSASREATWMQVTFTDAVDESESFTFNLVYGTVYWGSTSVYATVSFTEEMTFDSYGYAKISGTNQFAYGYDAFTGAAAYTEFGSFPVAAWTGDGVFSETPSSLTFHYDAATKVAGINDSLVKTIADLDNADFLRLSSKDLPNGEAYAALREKYTQEYAEGLFSSGKVRISLRFGNVSGESVSFLVESVGGKSWADLTEIADESGPAIVAEQKTAALRNFEYVLPVPEIRDNVDGTVAEYGVVVKSPEGEKISENESGFIPETAGTYTVVYSATDAAGNRTEKQIAVECYAVAPPVTFGKISGEEPAAAYETYDTVRLPGYRAVSDLSFGANMDVLVTVVKDGVTLKTFEDGGKESEYYAETAGDYEVIYTAVNAYGLNVSRTMYEFVVEEKINLLMPEGAETVRCGSTYTVPKVLGVYRNDYVPATFDVVSPSGKRVDVKDDRTFTADELGEYVITYRHEADGKAAVDTYIVTSVYTNAELFVGKDLTVTDHYTIPDFAEQAGETGVFISTASTEEFLFANHVDVNDMTKNDLLLQFIPYADSDVYAEFALSIILTDLYDASNKVTINVHPHPEQNGNATWTYSYVNYDGRPLAFSSESNDIMESSMYGCLMLNSMGGGKGMFTNVKPISFGYDASEKAVYVNTNFAADPWCLLDLDKIEHVGAGREWKGFTTGEVKLSFRVESIRGKAAGFIVTQVAGHDVSGESLAHDSVPTIYPEENEYFEIVNGFAPVAEVGTAYPLIGARAHDELFGEVACVYSLKKQGAEEELYNKVENGAFTPEETGIYEYTITATNEYGAKATYGYTFEVKSTVEDLGFAFATQPEQVTAGTWYTIPAIVVTGGSGKKLTQYRATLNGEELDIDALGEVYLYETGELSIHLSATDFLGSAMKNDTLTVAVTGGSEPVMEIAGVPNAALKGQNLILPDFTAMQYGDGPQSGGTDVYREIRVNGERIFWGTGEQTEGSLIYGVQGSGSLNVTYAAGTGEDGILVRETYVLQIVEGNLDAYFLPYDQSGAYNPAGVTALVTESDVRFTVTEDKIFRFANPLAAEGLVMEFGTLGENSAQRVTLVLEDYEDARQVLRLTFYTENGKTYLKVNDGSVPIPLSGTLGGENGSVYFRLSNFDRKLYNSLSNLITDLSSFANTMAFEGFTSGKVRVSFETGAGSLRIVRMGNQSFAGAQNGFTDTVAPQIVLAEEMPFSMDAQIDQEVRIPAAVAADVLASEATVTLTVMSPAGMIVDGLSGVPCDEARTVRFGQYGAYYIVYTMRAGNTTENYRCIVNVRDKVAPEIHVDGEPGTAGKVGEAFAVPTAQVTDNHSETQLFVFVKRPDGKLDVVTAGGSYTFVQAGAHKLIYYAYDAEYNVSVCEYAMEVSEG